jgi:AcrR family transcriptional regulator
MVQVVAERGYSGVTVALVTSSARVSNSTFYEQFDGLKDCFAAVLDLGLELPSAVIVRAFAGEDRWRDGVLCALAELLVFLDSEPALTRIWFGEALAAGSWALEHRERNIETVQSLIVEHWFPSGSDRVDLVLVKGVMSSILASITTHVVTKAPGPLIGLLASMASLVTSPFLDAESVREEVERAERLSQELLSERYPLPLRPTAAAGAHDRQRLCGGRRERECVLYLAQHPGASNQQIARGVGIFHSGQVSALLSRLVDRGLLTKHAGTPGLPNAWRLTPHGEQVAGAIGPE